VVFGASEHRTAHQEWQNSGGIGSSRNCSADYRRRVNDNFPQPFPGEIKAENPSPEPMPSIEQRAQRTSKARSGTGATRSPQGEHGEDPPFDGSGFPEELEK